MGVCLSMKSLKHRHPARLSAFLSAFIALIGLATFLVVGHVPAFATVPQQEGRLVTIHDRGSDTVILTKGDTVADALKQANISVDANDAVEPALSEKLVAKDYSVNIYRARPVIVVDGATRQKIITPYQTAQQIAKSVGITLYDEDKTALTRTDDIVAEGAGLQLTITRATPFNFTLYGATTVVRTQAKTIGEMLKEKGINLGKDDRISLDQSTPITADMTIRVWREGKQTVTVSEGVNFDVQTVQDGDQYIGYHAVQTPGINGSRNVTYEVMIQDGKEVGRTEIASITTAEPQKQIEIVGAKVKSFGGTCGDWMAAAGISDTSSAGALIARESGCNPYSVNRSSGACGVGQALPCSKTGCSMGDGACQMIWMNQYVIDRYGSWSAALGHSYANGWY